MLRSGLMALVTACYFTAGIYSPFLYATEYTRETAADIFQKIEDVMDRTNSIILTSAHLPHFSRLQAEDEKILNYLDIYRYSYEFQASSDQALDIIDTSDGDWVAALNEALDFGKLSSEEQEAANLYKIKQLLGHYEERLEMWQTSQKHNSLLAEREDPTEQNFTTDTYTWGEWVAVKDHSRLARIATIVATTFVAGFLYQWFMPHQYARNKVALGKSASVAASIASTISPDEVMQKLISVTGATSHEYVNALVAMMQQAEYKQFIFDNWGPVLALIPVAQLGLIKACRAIATAPAMTSANQMRVLTKIARESAAKILNP